MAYKAVNRTLFFMETKPTLLHNYACTSSSMPFCGHKFSSHGFNYGSRLSRARDFNFALRTLRLYCSHRKSPPSSPDDLHQGPSQDPVLKAISGVSNADWPIGQATNVVFGGSVTADSVSEWLDLDKKVNCYPTARGFIAIGTGGDDFVKSMVVAVETVLQRPIPKDRVKQRLSSRGKYVSVNIGPVQVICREQVEAVYNAMRRDDRVKLFL